MSISANALPTGQYLDEYRLASLLGAGGFGITYKAWDTHLQAWVAIKEYFPSGWCHRSHDSSDVFPNIQGQAIHPQEGISEYQRGLTRFLMEARVLASIQHRHVVRVRRYFQANNTGYIVMDYEEGQPF